MKKGILLTFALTISLLSSAQFDWGVQAGPVLTKPINKYVSGNPGSMIAELKQNIGLQAGLYSNYYWKYYRLGSDFMFYRNSFKLLKYPEEEEYNVMYASIIPNIGFTPMSGFWLDISTGMHIHLKQDYALIKNPLHLTIGAYASYQYKMYTLKIGYLKGITPYGSDNSGSIWDFYYNHIELTLGVRLGQFNPQKK
jgi:hypothetical protein